MKIQRDRSWRRAKKRQNKSKGMGCEDKCKPEKNWKLLYLRSEKIARAKQLGFAYPRKHLGDLQVEDDDDS